MKELRVIIAGSRDFDAYDDLERICDHILPKKSENLKITIISGTARGADSLGERYAKEHGYELVRMPADWTLYGKRAGYIRNKQMADFASKGDKGVLFAFWDGKSKGTKHMIDLAEEYGLATYVINFRTKQISHNPPLITQGHLSYEDEAIEQE